LVLNLLLEYLAWGVLIGAGIWMLAVLLERMLLSGVPLKLVGAGAGAVALAVAGIGTYRRRVDRLRAAIVLDQAAQLRERLSTALTCRNDPDPFARAAVRDAEQRAAGVHVSACVQYRAPRLWPWSLGTLVVAGALFWLMPQLDLFAGQQDDDQRQAAVEQERAALQRALASRAEALRKRLRERPALAELESEIEKLTLPDEPTRTPEDVRREAVKRIESVADRLRQRLEADRFNALERLKRDLARLQTPRGDDAASRLAQALASGDMPAARQAMAELKKELEQAAAGGDTQAQQKLAQIQKQLDELARQLERLASQQQGLKDLQNKAGLSEKQARELLEKLKGLDARQMAERLSQELADSGLSQEQIRELARKMAQQQRAMQQLRSLAQALAQCAQGCQQCQGGGQAGAAALAQALDGALGELSALELTEQMLNELRAQLTELEDLKEGVCQGDYGEAGSGSSDSSGPPGRKPGQGFGALPRQRAPHGYQTTKAPTRPRGGEIIGQLLIDGPQIKGEARAEATAAVIAAQRDAEDAIERDEIPRQYERVVRFYFERLAGLIRHQVDSDDQSDGGQPQGDSSADQSAGSGGD